jgi:hypothetical protein
MPAGMKIKSIITICILLLSAMNLSAQDIYFTRTGKIDFHAGTTVEDIDATNNEVASVLDITKWEVAFNVLIKSFHFRRTLMEEHFNENYLESTKYPKAVFKGKIVNNGKVNFNANGSYATHVEGDITIHGVTKTISAPATFIIEGKSIKAYASFSVKAQDFKIEIPGVVADKISKQISINIQCIYEPRN